MKHIYIAFVIFILFLSSYTYSQNNTISGIVLNSQEKPIPYATVYYNTNKSAVITNIDGKFTIKRQIGDTLVIRCLGYDKYREYSNNLKNDDNIIYLKTAVFELNEVVITNIEAKKIVISAVKKIPLNYPDKTTEIKGICKLLTMYNNKYSGFFKADMDIFVTSIISKKHPRIETKVNSFEVYKTQEFFTLESTDTNMRNFGIRKHPFIKNTNKYKYQFQYKIPFNNMILYKIKFRPKKYKPFTYQYAGNIYIDEETKGFVYFEYEQLPNKLRLHRKSNGRKEKRKHEAIKVMYTKNSFFDLAYIIKISTIITEIEEEKPRIILYNFFNFFSTSNKYDVINYNTDTISLYDIIYKSKGQPINQSENYKTKFIIESSSEKRIREKEIKKERR